jgi:hypothetical protein
VDSAVVLLAVQWSAVAQFAAADSMAALFAVVQFAAADSTEEPFTVVEADSTAVAATAAVDTGKN